MRAGLSFALAGFFISLSFGVVGPAAGLSPLETAAMSVLVFAAGAQFAAVAVLAQGGTVAAAVLAALLMNARREGR